MGVNNHLKTSAAGIELIKKYEGFRAKAYVCPAGVLTVGYGTTRNVYRGMVVNEQQATNLVYQDVEEFEREIKKSVTVPLRQCQFDALVCFVYNVGSGNFRSSTLLKRLNDEGYSEVPGQLLRWNKAGGRVLEGLNRRRTSEGLLWSTGKVS